jgi:16S rRNA (guanine527-N7)-methyltransferase
MRALEPELRHGLGVLGLTLDDIQVAKLLDYLDLIQKWTRVYNLTAVRQPRDMLTRHVLDSLAVIAPLRSKMSSLCGNWPTVAADGTASEATPFGLLDVGSGAGLPGAVIAICCPNIRVECVDTVSKKVAFIRQVAATLKLSNLHGLHARVESLAQKYAVVASRAFASLSDFVMWSEGVLAPGGVWMAMKGKSPEGEISALPHHVQVFHVEHLEVPGLGAERCIVWMRKT